MVYVGRERRVSERKEKMYGEALGVDALERQRQAAKDYHTCCGEWMTGPHHEECAKFVPDELPPQIEGQGSLL